MRIVSVLACVLVACGGKSAPPVLQGGPGDGAPPVVAADDPVVVLRALAKAAHDDDGRALDALIHPQLGLWLWSQPGAAVSPLAQLQVAAGERPSARLRATGLNDWWLEQYWPSVASGLDAGLGALDRDVTGEARWDPKYGDCGAEDGAGGPNLRAWLATGDDLKPYDMMLEDAQVTLDAKASSGLAHFHAWGLDVFLARDQGRWWVAHVMVWTPCDA